MTTLHQHAGQWVELSHSGNILCRAETEEGLKKAKEDRIKKQLSRHREGILDNNRKLANKWPFACDPKSNINK